MKIKKVYIEITNVCNMACEFCHGTKRKPHFMGVADFETAVFKAKLLTDYIYLHVLGEPLLHPGLEELLSICDRHEMKVTITTNGTLIKQNAEILLQRRSVIQLNYSLHCRSERENYLKDILDFTQEGSRITHVLRIWSDGVSEFLNEIGRFFGVLIEKRFCASGNGMKVSKNVYVQQMQAFSWPDINGGEIFNRGRCRALKNNIGILVDGTVVPCCLDADGVINLGNAFEGDLAEILEGERARAMKTGFQNGTVTENLCKTCGFAIRQNGYAARNTSDKI